MVFCEHCGTELGDDDLFCVDCGNKVTSRLSSETKAVSYKESAACHKKKENTPATISRFVSSKALSGGMNNHRRRSSKKILPLSIAGITIAAIVILATLSVGVLLVSHNHRVGVIRESVPAINVDKVILDIINPAGSIDITIEDAMKMEGQAIVAEIETRTNFFGMDSVPGNYTISTNSGTLTVSFEGGNFPGNLVFNHDITISAGVEIDLGCFTSAGSIDLIAGHDTNLSSLSLITSAGSIECDFKGILSTSFESADLITSAGHIYLDIEGLESYVDSFWEVHTSAGSIDIDFLISDFAPEENSTVVFDIGTSAGSIEITFHGFSDSSSDVGIRILESDTSIGSEYIDNNVIPQSSNYDIATLKLDFIIHTSVGSIDVDV